MRRKEYLTSWKEIADYAGHSERTIQRWEKHLAFPVHRPSGKLRSSVIGIKSEINDWLEQQLMQRQVSPTTSDPSETRRPPPPLLLWIGSKGAELKVRKRYLEAGGYRVIGSNDNHKGVNLFERHTVDLVIIDGCIAGFDIEVVTRMLRRRKPRVPIILLSGDQFPRGSYSLIDRVVPITDGLAGLLPTIANLISGQKYRNSRNAYGC